MSLYGLVNLWSIHKFEKNKLFIIRKKKRRSVFDIIRLGLLEGAHERMGPLLTYLLILGEMLCGYLCTCDLLQETWHHENGGQDPKDSFFSESFTKVGFTVRWLAALISQFSILVSNVNVCVPFFLGQIKFITLRMFWCLLYTPKKTHIVRLLIIL